SRPRDSQVRRQPSFSNLQSINNPQSTTNIALMMNVIANHNPKNSTSIPLTVPDHLTKLHEPLKNLKLDIIKEYNLTTSIDPQMKVAMNTAVQLYHKLNTTIINISL